MILLLLIVGVAVADKLDRRYLPPPTRNLSGGDADIIGLPFEYETKLKPSDVAIGLDRVSQKDTFHNTENEHSILDSFSHPEIISDTKSITHPIYLHNNDLDLYRQSNENSSDSLIPYKDKDEDKDKVYDESLNLEPHNYFEGDDHFISSQTSIPSRNSFLTHTTPKRIQDQADKKAVIINFDNSRSPEGYSYSYDTSNNIHADESANTLDGVKAKGSYSYLGDDGKLYSVHYTADGNGFRPQGDHLPTPPPIPSAILKVIEQAYKDKEAGKFDDGSYNDNKHGYRKYQKAVYHRNGYPSIYKTLKLMNQTLVPLNHNTTITDRGNADIRENDQYSQYVPEDGHIDRGDEVNDKTYLDIKETINNFNNKNNQIIIPSSHQGYEYSTPKYIPEDFTSRFSDYVHTFTEKTKDMIETTRKPFLTPYVTHNDEQELKEIDYHYQETPHDKLASQNNVIHSNKYGDHHFLPNNKQVKQGDEIDPYDDFLVPGEESYTYEMKLKDLDHSFKQPFATHVLPSTSSKLFSHQTNVERVNPIVISEPQTELVKNVPIYTTLNALLGNTTLSSAIVDEKERNIPMLHEGSLKFEYFPNAVKSHKVLPQTKLSDEIPSIGTTYSPYVNIVASDKEQNFKKYIGEDFTGPQQTPKFDAASGYYY